MSRDKERAAMIYLDESRVLTWRSRLPSMIMWNLLASRRVRDRHESCRANDGKHDGGGIAALVEGAGCTTMSSVLAPAGVITVGDRERSTAT
jgi:hypothetical protein